MATSASRRRPGKSESFARRTPRQERSLELVAKVVDATAHVLAELGLEKTSTNRIAERAGIAVGSIYQYFPNKEALIAAVVDDRMRRQDELVRARLDSVAGRPYPEAAEAVLRAVVDFYLAEPGLMSVLLGQMTRLDLRPADSTATKRIHEAAKAYLLAFADDLRIEDFDIAALLSTNVVSHFAPLIALQIDDVEVRERMILEVVRMLATYVGATASVASTPPRTP